MDYYLQSEKIRIEVGDRAGLIFTCFNIGTLYLDKRDKEKERSYIILAGYLSRRLGMGPEFSQMQEALGPIIEEIGEEVFVKIGQQLYESKKL